MSRAATIRRQLDLMLEIRDRIATEPGDDFERWMDALVPLTGDLIRELHDEESAAAGRMFNPWHSIYIDGRTIPMWEP
jgi:hypothetical protein